MLRLVRMAFLPFDQKLRPYNSPSFGNINYTQQAYVLYLFVKKD